jgi:2-polyprenyl-3-methyl-5-hydroxy-6-metoxy-1,4-benzoquinol methylase
MIDWEEPDCLLCGSRHWSPLVEAPDSTTGGTGLWFAVVQCQECGLCFTNPRPTEATIGRFYPSVYRPHRTPRPRRPRWRLRALRSGEQPPKECQFLSWRGEGRLLDFGCGGGSFLAHMHRRSWRVTGLDVSKAAVQRVRAELGLRALVGSLPHPELRPASFDVITMWHSLEHVHAPLEVLREAHRLLVPGGRLLVAAPNIDSWPFRWFGPAWYGLDLPRHLSHFSPWTLQLMLERAGFRTGPIRMVRHNDWLRSSAKLARQTGSESLWQRTLTWKPVAGLASWYCYLVRQSDCLLLAAER